MFSDSLRFEKEKRLSTHEDHLPFMDYDEYDAQVFRVPSKSSKRKG